jgi:hypothetical protein
MGFSIAEHTVSCSVYTRFCFNFQKSMSVHWALMTVTRSVLARTLQAASRVRVPVVTRWRLIRRHVMVSTSTVISV